jgi:hypothetical protein
MQPNPIEILRCCVENLEQLIIPEITSKHGTSAVNCIRMMLNHVALRLELEPAALAEDNLEKRAILEELATEAQIPSAAREAVASALAGISADADATSVNEGLRRGFIALLDADIPDEVRRRLRAQMRAQIEREGQYTLPALDGPLF